MRLINKHHAIHYLSLFILLGLGVGTFILFPQNPGIQLAAAVATGLSYVGWGIVHHYIHRDLTVFVIMEYVSVSILGLVLVYPLIFS